VCLHRDGANNAVSFCPLLLLRITRTSSLRSSLRFWRLGLTIPPPVYRERLNRGSGVRLNRPAGRVDSRHYHDGDDQRQDCADHEPGDSARGAHLTSDLRAQPLVRQPQRCVARARGQNRRTVLLHATRRCCSASAPGLGGAFRNLCSQFAQSIVHCRDPSDSRRFRDSNAGVEGSFAIASVDGGHEIWWKASPWAFVHSLCGYRLSGPQSSPCNAAKYPAADGTMPAPSPIDP